MNPRRRLLTALLVGYSASVAQGQQFADQIVGDTMPGWSLRGKATDNWIVQDGVLELRGTGKTYGEWMGTDRDYTDFIIELEYKVSPGGNSGVYLRTPPNVHASAVSFEIQLLDDYADKYKNLVPSQFTGSVYKIAAPSRQVTRPAGEWNQICITADGDHLVVVINGQTVVDASAYEYPEILRRSRKGAIGLQDHRTQAWFRNIRIADLARERIARGAWWWYAARRDPFPFSEQRLPEFDALVEALRSVRQGGVRNEERGKRNEERGMRNEE